MQIKKKKELILKLLNFQASKFRSFDNLENSNTYKVENSEIRRLRVSRDQKLRKGLPIFEMTGDILRGSLMERLWRTSKRAATARSKIKREILSD